MNKAQVNLRLRKELIAEIDDLIKNGHFSNKTEVFSEAIKLLVRVYKGEILAKKMDSIREETEAYPSPTEAVISSHEEEDEHLG
ncbi:MAG: hypothetical protein H3Z52_15300 [archaeon]|nr:hypothetical protein [archaeon]